LKDNIHARENVNHVIEIFQKAYKGGNHRDVAHCYNTLGAISSGEKKYDESLKYYQKALSILKVAVGEGHDAYADCYKNIGVAYYEMGDYPQALSYLKKALDIYIKLGGEDHSLAVSTKKELQTVYEKLLDLYPEDASIQEEYQQFKNTHMQTKK
jgi:tetratricopeptide (TPR) repeat protein